jgi:hypothetical protein
LPALSAGDVSAYSLQRPHANFKLAVRDELKTH